MSSTLNRHTRLPGTATKPLLALFAVFALSLCLLVGCGSSGGGTVFNTATGATVTGQISGEGDMSGIALLLVGVDAHVPPSANLRAATTFASSSQIYYGITEAEGRFVILNVAPGKYNLIARKDQNTTGIQQDIVVGEDVHIPWGIYMKLTSTGKISGKVQVPADYSAKGGIVAYIPGTSFSAYTDTNGDYVISGIPVGTYSVAIMASGLVNGLVENILVEPGKTTTITLVELAKDAAYFSDLIWKGELAAAPASPQINWAYYDTVQKKSFIWSGSAWQILAQDGAVGPQGPAGTFSSTFAYIYNQVAGTVNNNESITYSNNGVLTSDIAHAPGSADVIVNKSGTYEIKWSASVSSSGKTFMLYINNVPCNNAYVSSYYVESFGEVITTIAAGDVLNVKAIGGAALYENHGSTVNAKLSIIRLN